MKFILSIIVALFGFTAAIEAAPVDIKSTDGFILKGDYLAGAPSGAGVLLLHTCGSDRRMYDPVVAEMQRAGLHALAIDFRLYGESTSAEYSLEKYAALSRRERLPILIKVRNEKWGGDVLAAYDYLRARLGKDRPIGVIGASCGGSEAVNLASKRPVATLALFSFGVTDAMAATYQALPATPTLFISAEPEAAYARRLFDLATHTSNRFIQYKGVGHGAPLIERDPSLAGAISHWFATHLKR